MKSILIFVFAVFNTLNLIAQVEVCESKENHIVDVNSIDKCVITRDNISKKEVRTLSENLVLRKRFNNEKKLTNKNKISKELIDKLILKEKINLTESKEVELSN
ncbi:hypothetical protein H3Z83_05310 [Tenacibaculum sp. S7007]|uniref:Uncharacterized protein n=1 Tax=Tenacibaculum pelagium TaxID=2759527 RepID=A0A839ANI0_9FLAO|nr:hypothetical protein [Tenacibaculum pelagium]MBA6155938.1 hypothetical protein [Tenacibaculum pelagium]